MRPKSIGSAKSIPRKLSGSISNRPGGDTIWSQFDNDGADAVTGTFSGKPEGTLLTFGDVQYQLSYVGGTGNDVTLTFVGDPDITASGNLRLYKKVISSNDYLVLENDSGVIDQRLLSTVTDYTINAGDATTRLTVDFNTAGGYFTSSSSTRPEMTSSSRSR